MKKHALTLSLLALIAVLGVGAALLSAEPDALTQSLRDLGDADTDVRSAAIGRLKAGGSAMATRLLNELDGDLGTTQKAGIVETVRQIGAGTTHAGVLKDHLASNELSTRMAAVQILVHAPNLARNELAGMCQDKSETSRLRAAAAVALGNAGPQSRGTLLSLVRDDMDKKAVRRAAMRGLAACSAKGASDIAAIVSDKEASTWDREAAMTALIDSAEPALAELKTLMSAKDGWVRARATDGLISLKDPSSAQSLGAMLLDVNAEVRLTALLGLVALRLDSSERVQIGNLLLDGDPRVVCNACKSVAQTSINRAALLKAPLRGLLASGNFRVRYEAALALFAHGDNYGVATMRVDKNAAVNPWQTKLAGDALFAITGSRK